MHADPPPCPPIETAAGAPLQHSNYWIGGISMGTFERAKRAVERFRSGIAFGDLESSF